VAQDEEAVGLVSDVDVSAESTTTSSVWSSELVGKKSLSLLWSFRYEVRDGLRHSRGLDVVNPEASAFVTDVDDVIHIGKVRVLMWHVYVVRPELSTQLMKISHLQFLRRNRHREVGNRLGPFFIADVDHEHEVERISFLFENRLGRGYSELSRWNGHIGVAAHDAAEVSDVDAAHLAGNGAISEISRMIKPALPYGRYAPVALHVRPVKLVEFV